MRNQGSRLLSGLRESLSPFHGQQEPHSRLPGPYPLGKKFNWSSVTPTQ